MVGLTTGNEILSAERQPGERALDESKDWIEWLGHEEQVAVTDVHQSRGREPLAQRRRADHVTSSVDRSTLEDASRHRIVRIVLEHHHLGAVCNHTCELGQVFYMIGVRNVVINAERIDGIESAI